MEISSPKALYILLLTKQSEGEQTGKQVSTQGIHLYDLKNEDDI